MMKKAPFVFQILSLLIGIVYSFTQPYKDKPQNELEEFFIEEYRKEHIEFELPKSKPKKLKEYKKLCQNLYIWSILVEYVGMPIAMAAREKPICGEVKILRPGINDLIKFHSKSNFKFPAPDLIFCYCGIGMINAGFLLARHKETGYFNLEYSNGFTYHEYLYGLLNKEKPWREYVLKQYWNIDPYQNLIYKIKKAFPAFDIWKLDIEKLDQVLRNPNIDFKKLDIQQLVMQENASPIELNGTTSIAFWYLRNIIV